MSFMNTKVKQKHLRKNILYIIVKRCADIFLSLLALTVLSPVFLVTAIAIALEDGGPLFYNQKRVGKGKKIFKEKWIRNWMKKYV